MGKNSGVEEINDGRGGRKFGKEQECGEQRQDERVPEE